MTAEKIKYGKETPTPTLRPGPSPFTMTRTCNTPLVRAFCEKNNWLVFSLTNSGSPGVFHFHNSI